MDELHKAAHLTWAPCFQSITFSTGFSLKFGLVRRGRVWAESQESSIWDAPWMHRPSSLLPDGSACLEDWSYPSPDSWEEKLNPKGPKSLVWGPTHRHLQINLKRFPAHQAMGAAPKSLAGGKTVWTTSVMAPKLSLSFAHPWKSLLSFDYFFMHKLLSKSC